MIDRSSDKAFGMFNIWKPGVGQLPIDKEPNSSLRVATVCSEYFLRSMISECDLVCIKRNEGYGDLLNDVDFLLVESTLECATGDWDLAQSVNSNKGNELKSVVKLFRESGIPTVYWITMDHAYHEHFEDFSKNFDYIFCADEEEVQMLNEIGLDSEYLPPCVQPRIYNPFRVFDKYDAIDLGFIYDGWADLDRSSIHHELLKKIKDLGCLDIVESNYLVTRGRLKALDSKLADSIRGCVGYSTYPSVLKHGKGYLSFEESLSTPTSAEWGALKAAASYLPIIHLGSFKDKDIRENISIQLTSSEEFLSEIEKQCEDSLYRKRCAHLSWRMVYQNHTFSHRLSSICKRIGVNHDWEEFPKVSIVTPTYRNNYLRASFETYDKQIYPNKELVLVYNGNALPGREEIGIGKDRDDVSLFNVPSDLFAGATLNFGILNSTGKYCFRVDDDDYYGKFYITDMLLWLKAIDADLLGKPPVPLVFNDEPGVYFKKRGVVQEFMLMSGDVLSSGAAWLGGNSIGGKRECLINNPYEDSLFEGADTILNRNMNKTYKAISCDIFSLVAERRDDLGTHTWRLNKSALLKGAYRYDSMKSFLID